MGDAYLLAASGAGQFNVVDGQLVYYTAGTDNSSLLYMGVENPTNKTQRTLETWFAADENDYGTFAFSGDTLTWTVDDIDRPNTAAWLVCGDAGQLYINTGAYAYDTPSGCSDETVSQLPTILTSCEIVLTSNTDSLVRRFNGKHIRGERQTRWSVHVPGVSASIHSTLSRDQESIPTRIRAPSRVNLMMLNPSPSPRPLTHRRDLPRSH